jgi:hypothetical protein
LHRTIEAIWRIESARVTAGVVHGTAIKERVGAGQEISLPCTPLQPKGIWKERSRTGLWVLAVAFALYVVSIFWGELHWKRSLTA